MLFCPWCGDDLTPHDYYFDDEDEQIAIKCWNIDCDFHTTKADEGIPAMVVDEEIYRQPALAAAGNRRQVRPDDLERAHPVAIRTRRSPL